MAFPKWDAMERKTGKTAGNKGNVEGPGDKDKESISLSDLVELMQLPINRAGSAAANGNDYENGYDDDDSDLDQETITYLGRMLLLQMSLQTSGNNSEESNNSAQVMPELTAEQKRFRASRLIEMGNDHLIRRGQYASAMECYEEALKLAIAVNDRFLEGAACGSLGLACDGLGEFRAAIRYHERVLAIAKESGDRATQGRACSGLGSAYGSLGEYEKAIEYHARRLTIAKDTDDEAGKAIALSNLGASYWGHDDVRRAVIHFRDFSVALRALESNLSSNELRKYLLTFWEQFAPGVDVWVAAEMEMADSEEVLEDEMAVTGTSGQWTALVAEELLRRRTEMSDIAELLETASSDVSQETERALLAMDRDLTAEGIVQMVKRLHASYIVVLKLWDNRLCTWVLEGSRGDLVYASIKSTEDDEDIGEIDELIRGATFDTWHQMRNVLREANELIAEDSTGESTEQILRERLSAEKVRDIVPPSLWDDWQKLYSYPNFREVVSGTGILFERIRDGFAQKALEKLSALLLQPIMDNVPAVQRALMYSEVGDRPVYFMPNVALTLVPFAALKVDDEQYLIEKAQVIQASSFSSLAASAHHFHIAREQPANSKAMVVSNPTSDNSESLDLEGRTLEEMLGISALSKRAATKRAVVERIRDSSILHFCGHGTVSEEVRHKREVIFLADKGYIDASDIFHTMVADSPQALRARLMVLSFCLSGSSSEGLFAFIQAVLAGGCPCLLGAKWVVPAYETFLLISEFYGKMPFLKGKHKTVGAAYRAAVMDLLQDAELNFYKSHYYWAGFILHGFADVALDDEFLKRIKSCFETK